MVGLWPALHEINPLLLHESAIAVSDGVAWLREHVPGAGIYPPHQQLEIYWGLWAITVPEFINVNVDDYKGIWRVPYVAGHGNGVAAGVAMMLAVMDQASSYRRTWFIHGEGVDDNAGDIFLEGTITMQEYEALIGGEFPTSLLRLGTPGPMLRMRPSRAHLAQLPGRPPIEQSRNTLHAMEAHPFARRPPPQIRGPRGMGHRMDRGMDHGEASMPHRRPRQRLPVRHQQMVPIKYTDNDNNSSSDSSHSTDANTDDDSDAPRKSTKTKLKGKSKSNKSGGKKSQRKKQQERGDSTSESEDDDDDPPRRLKKSEGNTSRARGKNPARRRRSLSEEGLAHSADEKRGKTMPKARGRGSSDDEGDAPARTGGRAAAKADGGGFMAGDDGPNPSRGKVPKAGGRRSEGRARGRSPSDDEGPGGRASKAAERRGGGKDRRDDLSEDETPPPLDPAEQARMDALKAQNGYRDGKAEKKWKA
ncbi:MAG: hypothetical protein L6R40_000547 [Gallowayella cf. fulva]|nr:MAG: hypothetical protein L6R40_000547 [Xanthomendoza cf. fulva]